jgi:hypothetical protein
MWALAKDEVAQNEDQYPKQKFTHAIMWNPHGFHVIYRPLIGAKINNTYYTTNILQPFQEAFFPRGRNPHGKPLVMLIDNCSVHRRVTTELFMKTQELVSMPPPPNSTELALSDFLLFPTAKEKREHIGLTD